MTKIPSLILLLLFGSVPATFAQQRQVSVLSDVDKAAIVESVLDVELRNEKSPPDFASVRDVSSENIQFMTAPQLSKHGFTLVAASELCEWRQPDIGQYLVFKQFAWRDGVAVISLFRVSGGESCFGGRFHSELRYTYEARLKSDGWVAELTRRPLSFYVRDTRPMR